LVDLPEEFGQELATLVLELLDNSIYFGKTKEDALIPPTKEVLPDSGVHHYFAQI
jgi:hypothetical protein